MAAKNLIVFDLDGVITGEDAYWDTAGLVSHELLYSPLYWHIDTRVAEYQPVTTAEESRQVSRAILPEAVIVRLKSRSVNSNWDTCYAGFCMYLIYLLSHLPDVTPLLPLRPSEPNWIANFRFHIDLLPKIPVLDERVFTALNDPVFEGYNGLALLERFNAYASKVLHTPIKDVFARYSPSWWFCERLFQEWYLGDKLYIEESGHVPVQTGKPGCIHFEQPLLPIPQLKETLEKLGQQGYTFGVATGRPREEALLPLERYGLLNYFDMQHVTTHAEVAQAEAISSKKGRSDSLVKPHPYQFLLAAHPGYLPDEDVQNQQPFIVVGDTPSDVNGGHAAGAIVVAVKTGARTAQALTLLEQSEPDFLIENVTKLPTLLETMDSLATIQKLQFTEREKAERLLRWWFANHMNLTTERVTLTPKAVSLNSFNGFYRTQGEEYFFKTHVEEQGILEEYYHAELLREAGYNIVRPIRTLHEQGQQMVIYPVVRWPVMFDLMRGVETSETGEVNRINAEMLIDAERRECKRLLAIYATTQQMSSAMEQAHAPIHQLFWHRLVGERYRQFYEGKNVPIPHKQETISFEKLLTYRWTINGMALPYTLGELVDRAKITLDPVHAGITIIGHGDAHFGNVFLEEKRDYLYFDPAFAGRHSLLLDVIKPLFHNVFATWMYFPYEIDRDMQITVEIRDTMLVVNHSYTLTPLRKELLQTKEMYLLSPLLERLGVNLPDDWLAMMQSALMCCPLLTMNLFDTTRMPTSIGWLGLSLAVLMGNNGMQSWKLRADE